MRRARLFALLALAAPGCGAQLDPGDEETAPPVTQTFGEESVNCASPHPATGYENGSPVQIELVTADGKPIEVKTASSYHAMQVAAAHDGIGLTVVSGFRTYQEQQYLYSCYTHCNCNSCNLAARPGYSNHESGHALDLNTSNNGVYAWLEAHAASFGFHRTVPSEIWHWEYWGPLVPGPCSGGSSGPSGTPGAQCFSHTLARDVASGVCVQSATDGNWYHCAGGGWVGGATGCSLSYAFCHSSTLGKDVPARTCVESKYDRVWYQCDHQGWVTPVANGAGPVGACSSEYPL
jgi:hypothetical protein